MSSVMEATAVKPATMEQAQDFILPHHGMMAVFVDTTISSPTHIFTVHDKVNFAGRHLPIFPMETNSDADPTLLLSKYGFNIELISFPRLLGYVQSKAGHHEDGPDFLLEVWSVQGGKSDHNKVDAAAWVPISSFLRQPLSYEQWMKPVVMLCCGRSADWRVQYFADNSFLVNTKHLTHSSQKGGSGRMESFET